VVDPGWTGATVFITRAASVDGTTDEKTAILDVYLTIQGTEVGLCRFVTRQTVI
jgi:hypothetical protein